MPRKDRPLSGGAGRWGRPASPALGGALSPGAHRGRTASGLPWPLLSDARVGGQAVEHACPPLPGAGARGNDERNFSGTKVPLSGWGWLGCSPCRAAFESLRIQSPRARLPSGASERRTLLGVGPTHVESGFVLFYFSSGKKSGGDCPRAAARGPWPLGSGARGHFDPAPGEGGIFGRFSYSGSWHLPGPHESHRESPEPDRFRESLRG